MNLFFLLVYYTVGLKKVVTTMMRYSLFCCTLLRRLQVRCCYQEDLGEIGY